MESKRFAFQVKKLNLIEMEDGSLFWDGLLTSIVQKVMGKKCVIIKPYIVENAPNGMSHFKFDKQLLFDIGVQLQLSESTNGTHNQLVNKVKCLFCGKEVSWKD